MKTPGPLRSTFVGEYAKKDKAEVDFTLKLRSTLNLKTTLNLLGNIPIF